ncbi:MAG TPA: glycogen debranching N-terminal domain-containing protein [Thermoanaerobaculia bacterium]|nr:glycogen debranching N-terminal domain-containing protein [Thermoanaerobaculia bacterium]
MQTLETQAPFSILATEPRADEQTRVLKHGESFAVFDQHGAIHPAGLGELGLFHEGTRFLNRLEVFLGERRPLLLSSSVRRDSALLVDLTNPDFKDGTKIVLPRDTLHLFALSFLWDGACYVRWRVRNYGLAAVDLRLGLVFAADYADIFEVRGIERQRRGNPLPPAVGRDMVVLGYQGLDGVTRRTRLAFSEPPAELIESYALFRKRISAHEEETFQLTVSFETGERQPRIFLFEDALASSEERLRGQESCCAAVATSNARFDEWIHRSAADLRMMLTETPHGLYPYAGIPWFSTVFGRDGIFTALEMLWMDPAPARGVLSFLAATQAGELDSARDAEPGKILHELRGGEMAALGEIPFGRYYGTVDATPLFVVLAGAYYERTGDLELIESIWPNIERALAWIDDFGDQDGDGFVEYARRSATGLTTQGWKDSVDSVFHADGRLAEPPVALCEVQGYVWAARYHAAALARLLGRERVAEEQERRARELRERFEESFWCEEIATYALALDGAKRPCRVITSNPGHCLFSGIASPERARRVAASLLSATSFSGWGIRTVDASEKRYNPMSYHNGSIWPHDNAVIAYGMARYGLKDAATRVLTGLFDASLHMDLQRMPELFCGFHRRPHEGPTRYPVACSPQAWSAGAVFLLLQACLGLEIDAPRRQIRFSHPELPPCLERIELRDVRVAGATADLQIRRYPRDVAVSVDRKEGELEVLVMK